MVAHYFCRPIACCVVSVASWRPLRISLGFDRISMITSRIAVFSNGKRLISDCQSCDGTSLLSRLLDGGPFCLGPEPCLALTGCKKCTLLISKRRTWNCLIRSSKDQISIFGSWLLYGCIYALVYHYIKRLTNSRGHIANNGQVISWTSRSITTKYFFRYFLVTGRDILVNKYSNGLFATSSLTPLAWMTRRTVHWKFFRFVWKRADIFVAVLT